ncbi:MAG: putative metal-binding motif-containing protein [Deltaproteobacteria bacterium]|nr:putative metal-binding motif-containing protein [Deltaproteobacteria bacterium]
MLHRARLFVALAMPAALAGAGCGRVRFTTSDAGLGLDAVGGPDTLVLGGLDASSPIGADAFSVDVPGLDAFSPDAFSPIDASSPTDAASLDAFPGDAPCVLVPLHPDRDGDGFGDPRQTFPRCPGTPGFVLDGTDCDDTSATSRPGGTETCNCRDDDCDGTVDPLPSCMAASHVVWVRAYGGPSSDAPWQIASDDIGVHVVGQSWMGGFEILPGVRTGGNLYEARFDARTGLGLWGRGSSSISDDPIGVGLFGDRLYALHGSPIRLDVGGRDGSSFVARHTSSGTGAYGGSSERLAIASDDGVAFVHAGFDSAVNVGLGSVATRGSVDTVLYRVAVDGSVAWQRTFGTTSPEYERMVATDPSGSRVAIALQAGPNLDMGGGPIAGTDLWVFGLYDGANGDHLASGRSADLELSMAFAGDGTLFIARPRELEIRNTDGGLRERRALPAFPSQIAITPDGDLVVAYGITDPTTIGGVMYVPTDGADGLVVRYVGTSTTVRWAQQLDGSLQALVAGPSGDLYGVGGVPVSAPWAECGGVSAPGGGDAGDADIVLVRLR